MRTIDLSSAFMSTQEEIKAFLISQGFSRETGTERMSARMGPTRYPKFLELYEECIEMDNGRELFQFLETPQEFNLYFRIWADVTLEIGAALYAKLNPLLCPGTHVADLGRFSDGYLAWLATKNPGCVYVGFDHLGTSLDITQEVTQMRNLSLVSWDYTNAPPLDVPKFDVMYTILGIEFGHLSWDLDRSIDVTRLTDCDAYRTYLEHCRPYFASWKAIATDDARLYAVLSLGSLEHYLAVVDAAQEAGWTLDVADSCRTGDDYFDEEEDDEPHGEGFDILSFTAGKKEPASRRQIIEWFSYLDPEDSYFMIGTGRSIVAAYLGLENKRPTATRDFEEDNGIKTRVETGVAGDSGYVFTRASDGQALLQFVPPDVVDPFDLSGLQVGDLPLVIPFDRFMGRPK